MTKNILQTEFDDSSADDTGQRLALHIAEHNGKEFVVHWQDRARAYHTGFYYQQFHSALVALMQLAEKRQLRIELPAQEKPGIPDSLSDDVAEAAGAIMAQEFAMAQDSEHEDRWITETGTRTNKGIARRALRLIQEAFEAGTKR